MSKLFNNVLVTGNTGYIGSILCPILIEAGYNVRGFDTNYFEGCDLYQSDSDVDQIVKDLRHLDASDLEGIDAVIHLGGLSNDPLGAINPNLTFDINQKASVHLANLAKKAGVKRFLFSSSCSVYGVADGDNALTENSQINPVTAYAVSKAEVEKELSLLADDDFSPVYLRNSTVYGLSPKLRLDLVVNNLVAFAHTTGQIKIMSDGSPWRPMIHVHDVSNAFLALMEADRELIHNESFNVGQNIENYQIRDMADKISELMPEAKVEYTGEHGSDSRTYKVCFDKIASKIEGFKPEWNLGKGVLELRDAYEKYGLTFEQFQGRKYIRLAHIKYLIDEDRLDGDLFWVN